MRWFRSNRKPPPAAPPSDLVERFEALRRRLHELSSGPGGVSLLFFSCDPGAGTSTVALRCARALSTDVRSPVLLVDANLRRPSLHEALGRPRENGLVELTEDGRPLASVLSRPEGAGFAFVSAGRATERPTAVFESERLAALLQGMKASFRFVVVDGAPVLASPETVILATKVDAAALVLEAEVTRWEVAQLAKAQMQAAGAKLLGTVLNKRRYYIPQSLYSRL